MTNNIDMAKAMMAGGCDIDEDTIVENKRFSFEHYLEKHGLIDHNAIWILLCDSANGGTSWYRS